MLNTNVTASAADTLARVPYGATKLPVDVVIGSGITATVAMFGRSAPDAAWVPLGTVSASGTTQLDFVRYLRVDVNITAGGGGANTVQVTAPYSAERIGRVDNGYQAVPVGVTRPVITGRPEVGETLTVSGSAYTNNPTAIDRQWLRRRLAILGATSSTYVLTTADIGCEIACEETPRNAAGAGRTWRSRGTDGVRGPNSAVLVPDHVNTWNPKGNGVGTPAPTPAPTPTPSPVPGSGGSIGGIAIGSVATSGPETGMTLVYGDDFDGPLDLMGPAPAQRFGRYATTRGNYLIYDQGQQPRSSAGLGGVDADPYWTGHLDSNRGKPIASLSDIIVQSGGKISLRQRDMAAGEAAHVPLNNQNVMSSMFHTAFDCMFTAPFVVKWREQRFANNRDHMTTWFMQNMGFTRDDAELDVEAGSHKDGTGDGRQIEFNNNIWTGVNRSGSRSSGSNPITVDYSTPKVYALQTDVQGVANYYLEGALQSSMTTEGAKVLGAPYHLVGSNHMYNVTRPPGVSRLEYDYWQLYIPGKHYVPKVAPMLIQVASGESKTVVLPSQLELWGGAVTEKLLEACMMEPNEPGGTTNGVFYLDLPPGVTLNDTTRELTINVTTPGRLNLGRYVKQAGCSSKVHRIAIEVGPVINVPDFTVTQGVPFSLDLYPLVNCGVLVTDGTNKAKTISVSGLPSGMSYDDSTGILSGTTNAATGLRTVTITATNSVGQQATKSVNLNVAAAPVAGSYAYESLPGLVARFDASRDAAFAVASGDFTALGNAIDNAGDLAKASTVTPSPSRVPNGLGSKPVIRFTKNGVDGAGTTVLESAQNATGATVPVASVLTGTNTPFTLVVLVKFAAGSGTCIVGGLSEQVSTSAARNATIVKRDGATADSSFRFGATTATSADVSIGRLLDDVWYHIVARHNADGTSDVWVNDTRVVTAAPHTSSSVWAGTARYSLGNCQGHTANASRYPATGLAGDLAENLFFTTNPTDAEIGQMRTDFKAKWGL